MTWLDELRPEVPTWALDAGLPRPFRGETFVPYCERMGFSELEIGELTVELTSQTAPIANLRLRHLLARHLPDAWEEYVYERIWKARLEYRR